MIDLRWRYLTSRMNSLGSQIWGHWGQRCFGAPRAKEVVSGDPGWLLVMPPLELCSVALERRAPPQPTNFSV